MSVQQPGSEGDALRCDNHPPLPPQAVPAYIEKVDWGNLSESLEVYSLLDQIAEARESFPVEVGRTVMAST